MSIQCKAAVLYVEGEPLRIENILVAPPSANEVRIKMVAAGICASDGHFVWGEQKLSSFRGLEAPVVLGHEGAGVVESFGANVKNIDIGDYVLTAFMPNCKECQLCRESEDNLCELRSPISAGVLARDKTQPDGTQVASFAGLGVFSEYTCIDSSQVVKIDNRANLETACIISCSVTTGFYSAIKAAKVKSGSKCAIWGLGGIGLNAVYGCKVAGAKTIIGIDVNANKEVIAREFGATHFINPKQLDVPIETYLVKEFGGGVNFAFDCLGAQTIIDSGCLSLAPGGTFTLIGLPKEDTKIQYPAFNLLSNRKIIGAFLGSKKASEAYPDLCDMYIDGKYQLDKLITNKFRLAEINEAFKTLKDGNCIRSVIVFG